MPERRPVSELEGCVLGVVWLLGEATPYEVRTRFAGSPSTWWSGSAGAIYPLVRRLRARGLLRSTPRPTGRRDAEAFSLTARGRDALRAWLWRRVEDDDASDFDPLRIRVRFLAALPAPEQRRFLRDARRSLDRLEARIVETNAAYKRERDTLRYLTGRGAWHCARARRRWLEEVERTLARRHASPERATPGRRARGTKEG